MTLNLRGVPRDRHPIAILTAARWARDQGVAKYRYLMGMDDGEQVVNQIHLHLQTGRRITLLPG